MAIRFVDKEPEAGKARPTPMVPDASAQRPAPAVHPSPEPQSTTDGRDMPADSPAPKPRSRKAQPPSADSDSEVQAPIADGLLPGLQAHAKPTPKPRGRKKAFG